MNVTAIPDCPAQRFINSVCNALDSLPERGSEVVSLGRRKFTVIRHTDIGSAFPVFSVYGTDKEPLTTDSLLELFETKDIIRDLANKLAYEYLRKEK